MKRRTVLATYADAALGDTVLVAALIEPALQALDDGRNGYPAQTPGANPGTASGGSSEPASSTERAALNTDVADTDAKALNKAVRGMQAHARIAAIITQRWATPVLDHTQITQRLASIDAGIWCANCVRSGHKNTRLPKGDLCEFCTVFRRDWKQLPPKDVLDLRAAKGRLYESDIRRILARGRTSGGKAS